MKNIAIILARSGSKGLKDKNIKLLNNKPMIAYTIEAAKKSRLFDNVVVSTDSEKYAKISIKYGAEVPFLRSAINSQDTASSWDAVSEVLQSFKISNNKIYDTVCLLQPTSPLRTYIDIVNGYDQLKRNNATAVTSVCIVDHPPVWCNTLPEDKNMQNFECEEYRNIGRQQLPLYYRINGALYIRKLNYLDESISFDESKHYAYVMDKENSIDIDDLTDFKFAEYMMARK